MKRILIALTFVALALCSCGKDGGKERPNDYGFRYPTNCLGDGAVWWTMHENRICKEPLVRETTEADGYIYADYTATLDLRECGFLGINDYFGQIEAAGYTMLDGDDELADWLNPTKRELHTYFYKEAHQIGFNFEHNWRIQLHGCTKDSSLDDNSSLIITYMYQHCTP